MVVIFLVTAGPDSSGYSSGVLALISLWLGKLGCLYLACRFLFSVSRVRNPASYMKAERAAHILAIIAIGLDVYYFHGLYYLLLLPGFKAMPILAHIILVGLFFFYLVVGWVVASRSHNLAFGRRGNPWVFIGENLRANIPIALPWVAVSLWMDLLKIVPWVWFREFMVEGYGELVVFALFFIFLALVFPPLLVRMWRCTPIPAGPVRDELVGMCDRLHLRYRDVLIWPLFGGQVLTAGVVGFVARFRYILITNGLLANLTRDEVESVIAHETGHVKYYHMPLYLFVLLGFSLIIAPVLCGVNYLVLKTDWAFKLMESLGLSLVKFVEINEMVFLFVAIVLFLRFVFGYFMRNFERQADLHAFTTTGGSGFLASALEKVAFLSGDIRDLPSWHHFGVGQRVDFLVACEAEPSLVHKHHRKVRKMLVAYGLLMVLAVGCYSAIPGDYLEGVVVSRAEGLLLQEMGSNPDNPDLYWAMGDFYYRQKEYLKAVAMYNKSLVLREENPEVHNNLAWLFVTCEDEMVRDAALGLKHAKRAVVLHPAPHILDTYAHALWLNGRRDEAIRIEMQALHGAENTEYQVKFRRQIILWQQQLHSVLAP